MTNKKQTHLHPIERAHALDSKFRRLFQNPTCLVSRYIKPGMSVLDLGCGTGYFTTEIARHLKPSGKVIAADVQQGMLNILSRKIEAEEWKDRIEIHRCPENGLGLKENFDFIIAFYSFHEMKDLDTVINELKSIMKPGARILIAEQKFHVSKAEFYSFIEKMKGNGFKIVEKPVIFLSRARVMKVA